MSISISSIAIGLAKHLNKANSVLLGNSMLFNKFETNAVKFVIWALPLFLQKHDEISFLNTP